MAVPKLYRLSDGLLVSDKCVEWSDWNGSYAQSEDTLLSGLAHSQIWGLATYRGTAVFKFDNNFPSSNHDKRRLLFALAQQGTDFRFLDLEGKAYRVTISGPPSNERVAPRHRLVTHVTVGFLRHEELPV